MHTKLLAAALLTAGLVSAPAHATSPFPNQSVLWSRDQTNFGAAVAIAPVSGDTIAVFDSNFAIPIDDTVFVYQFINGAWTEVARLTPDNEGIIGGAFPNVVVSDDGSFIALALPSVIDVFQKPAGGWKDMPETAQLSVASSSFRSFTTSYMGANGTDIAAVFETTSLIGEIAVFTKPAAGWKSTSSPDAILTQGFNGAIDTVDISMAVSDGLIVVPAGSPSVDIAYIYGKPVSGWTGNGPDTSLISSFGIAGIALSDSTLALSGGNSIKIFQGPSWSTTVATLSSSTAPSLSLDNLLTESPNLVVAGNTGDDSVYGYQKPSLGWADATDADFTITAASRVLALAATDSTVVLGSGAETCPTGLPGTVGALGTTLLCPLVYAYDSGAVTAQTADLLAAPAVEHGAAFVGKPFDLTYAISNAGTASADNVQTIIPLPSVITGVHAVTSQGSCVDQTTQLVCNLGSIAASASAAITISAVAPTKAQTLSQGVTTTTTSPERSIRDGTKPLTYRVDTPPVADQLSISVFAGVAKLQEMAASDADHDKLTYRVVTQPAHGTVTVETNSVRQNSYFVTMSSTFLGQDSFRYVANDGFIDSNVAKVSITVTAPPPPPTAHPPLISTHAGGFGVVLDLFMLMMLALRQRWFSAPL